MARFNNLAFLILLTLLSIHITVSIDSPSPASHSGDDSPADDDKITPAPTPAPHSGEDSQVDDDKITPAPAKAADEGLNEKAKTEKSEVREGGGMSGGKKAGIALGVIGAVCVVGFGGFVYKKRKENVRQSEYGYDDRRDIL